MSKGKRFKMFSMIMFLGFFCLSSNFLIFIEIIGACLNNNGIIIINFNRYNELYLELIIVLGIISISLYCLISIIKKYFNKKGD
ncbi:hypothetical protein LCGC14_0550060 [marine sediment metagenome]|uniref:Uncharacterized protein n=1 Tax=marine sediment metagenome TaxID=412755 RepID=A0A0F9RV11_9ZZZZ